MPELTRRTAHHQGATRTPRRSSPAPAEQPAAAGTVGMERAVGTDDRPHEGQSGTAPRATIVIPTCQRAELLDRCLAACQGQDFAPDAYEILVVDDGPCLVTRRLVQRHARQTRSTGPTIRYLATTGHAGPAAARNVGWRAARAPVIAFTDDDCVPARDWLRAGVDALRAGAQAAAGAVIMPVAERPTDYERDATRLALAGFVTANCFCQRTALADVGGFDERFTQAWREDSDLYFSLLEQRHRVLFAPQARVVHPVRPAPWGVSLRQQSKSRFNALLYKKHPTLYRARIQARPPWHYYASVAALLATLSSAVAGRRALAAGAGLLWFVLTARFCARRLRQTSHAPRHVAEMALTSALIPPLAVYWRLRGAWRFRVWFC